MAVTLNALTTGVGGLQTTGDTSGAIQLQSNGTATLTVDTSGNVGIGTTSPTYKLNVTTASDGVQIFSTNGTIQQAVAYSLSGVSYTGTITNHPSAFLTNNAERMRIDSSGNVGINIINGSSKLEVAGSGSSNVGSKATYEGTIKINEAGSSTLQATGGLEFKGSVFGAGYGSKIFSADDGQLLFGNRNNSATWTERMRIDLSGGLILAGSTAQKATGTTWSNPSDQRLKDNIRDYTKGTTELMQVRVREWEYNGKGGTTEGMKGLGVVADEVMTVLPDTVETYNAKLNADDEEDTEIKKFDATEITWLLVKTVQEQQTIINSLTARVTALEGAK